MRFSCFRMLPKEADMPVSASHGFQGFGSYESPIWGVLRLPLS